MIRPEIAVLTLTPDELGGSSGGVTWLRSGFSPYRLLFPSSG